MKINVFLNCHDEGNVILNAVKSIEVSISNVKRLDVVFNKFLILDSGDLETTKTVQKISDWKIHEVNFRDLGLSRNFGIDLSDSDYINFCDADDLMDPKWFVRVINFLDTRKSNKVILHPEFILLSDHFQNTLKLRRQISSKRIRNLETLFFIQNLWASPVFASTLVFKKIKYKKVDFMHKLGWEDWTWNQETILNHLPHFIVKKSYHIVQVREASLSNKLNKLGQISPYPFLIDDLLDFFGKQYSNKFKNIFLDFSLFLKSLLTFDSNYYKYIYSDLQKSKINLFWHFFTKGYFEGRFGNDSFKSLEKKLNLKIFEPRIIGRTYPAVQRILFQIVFLLILKRKICFLNKFFDLLTYRLILILKYLKKQNSIIIHNLNQIQS